MQSDIQARLQDINRRCNEAKAKRDSLFLAIIGYHLLIIAGVVVFGLSLSAADHQFKLQNLDQQEAYAYVNRN